MFATIMGHQTVAGHYTLAWLDRLTGQATSKCYPGLSDIAIAIYYAMSRYEGAPALVCAYSPKGKSLNITELAAYGHKIHVLRYKHRGRANVGYTRRQGPVEGIGRSRNSHYFRRLHTTAARRQAGGVLQEEGEIPPRAARNAANIPNSWDDVGRNVQRGWKAQRKGRKAWDRRCSGSDRL